MAPRSYRNYELRFLRCILGGTAVGGLTATSPIGVENVMCPSNATSPAQCTAVAPPETSRCFGGSSAAGVRCTQGMFVHHTCICLKASRKTIIYNLLHCINLYAVITPCFSEGEFRLTNVSNSTNPVEFSIVISGRVEVCYNGAFGSICDSGWDEPEARVFCTNFVTNLGIPPYFMSEFTIAYSISGNFLGI